MRSFRVSALKKKLSTRAIRPTNEDILKSYEEFSTMSSELLRQVEAMHARQLLQWPMAQRNYEALGAVQIRTFSFDGFKVYVQFNPARAVSSGAKVDAKTIAQRPCFLCQQHRPAEQEAINWGKYQLLVNPFPIFNQHLTIACQQHRPQLIAGVEEDMLLLAKELEGLAVFYNGARCGASAPDHLHFQAGEVEKFPLIGDYQRLKAKCVKHHLGAANVYELNEKEYLRTVFVVEHSNLDAVLQSFQLMVNELTCCEEPMMNVVAYYNEGCYRVFIIPRGGFRPWQYEADEPHRLMISPATVEMCGLFIAPVEAHFQRITQQDIVDIFQQTSWR